MSADLTAIVDDLAAEEEALASILAGMDEEGWACPTPAAGWTVLDQVAHLAEGEELAGLALRDEAAFAAHLAALLDDLEAALAAMEDRGRAASPGVVAQRWDAARRATVAALRTLPAGARVSWVTGPMSSGSFATARLMETWAHGQDIVDGLGVGRPPSTGLRHIAHLGVSTRGFSFRNRALEPPAEAVLVDLTGPAGEQWRWGPDDAPERITGPALDFCLVVTQRRHPEDTDLVVVGPGAQRWMALAQVFAGPPTDGPPARR